MLQADYFALRLNGLQLSVEIICRRFYSLAFTWRARDREFTIKNPDLDAFLRHAVM